jgi:hypothetical protein
MRLRSPLRSLIALPLLLTVACGENGSESGSDQRGSSGSSGSSGSTTGGTGGASGNATGGSGGSAGGAGTGGEFCGGLAVSGLVRFEIGDETLLVGTMNDDFFDEARRLLEAGEQRIPVFNTLVDGTGCDAQWSWHPDPSDMEFADFTVEICDGVPSYIEENEAEWMASVGYYCPWSARVTEVTIVEPL